jgi:hypothetical protein
MKQQANYEELFATLEAQGVHVSAEYRRKIQTRMNGVLAHEPTIGVFGKTGAGKSSLCNAIFGREICEISDVAACTRSPKEVIVGIGDKGLKLLDVPGVGESSERDKEYQELYRELLPRLDLVLWVLKGDDRAFSSDEEFYHGLVKPELQAGKPFFIVLNQIDKIEPFREWDETERRPGVRQASNIEEKRRNVAGFFDLPLDQVIAVSANERFGLVELVDAIVHALPDDQKLNVLREVKEENRSNAAKKEAEEGFVKTLIDVVVDLVPHIPQVAKAAAKQILKSASEWKVWPWNWF